MSRARELVLSGILIVGGVLAALAGGEVTVRLLDVTPKMLQSLNVGTYDLSDNPILRYVYQPGYRPDQEAYDVHHQNFSINSDGFRDREFTRTKAPGTIRIVTLGDSVTAGNGVQDVEKIYPRVLERRLRESLGESRHEVYNLAVGGYHTLQQAEMLRVRGLDLDPDIAIIGFCINDFSWIADGNVYGRLKDRLWPQRGAVLDPVYWLRAAAAWVLSHSRLAFVLFYRLVATDAPDTPTDLGDAEKNPVELGFDILDRIQKEGALRIIVVVIPGFDWSLDQYVHGHIHQELTQIAARHPNIELIDLLGDFRVEAERTGRDGRAYALDGLHPNELGHSTIAELLFARVAATPKGWLP